MKNIKATGCSLALSLLILGTVGITSRAAAQPVSPAGTWDLIISGTEKGVAYITFDEGGTLSGYETLSPSKPGEPDDEASRNDGSVQGRVVIPSTTPGGETTTRLLGFGLLSGTWSYDSKGKVIGVYTEGSANRSCTTNEEITAVVSNAIIDFKTNVVTITVTNYFTNQVINCVTNPITNGVSFVAIVHPDRISIKSKGPNGNMTLKGIPAMDAPDISGPWYALGKKSNTGNFTEFLTLSPSAEFFNGYEVIGQGPGYELFGIALISNQKKLGLVTVSSAEDSPLSSGFGGINAEKGRANLGTVDLDSVRGQYKMTRQPLF